MPEPEQQGQEPIDFEKALIEIIDNTVSNPDDKVEEILGVGVTDQETTAGAYKTKGGRELGFEISDDNIELFTMSEPFKPEFKTE